MTTQGIELVYLETHNWGKSVAFWQMLGFKLDFETDHHSGVLVAANGTRIFLAEQAVEIPLESTSTSPSATPTHAGPGHRWRSCGLSPRPTGAPR